MYEVLLERSAERDLKALSTEIFHRVIPRIRDLANSPRPSGCHKITGSKNDWRIRIGDYDDPTFFGFYSPDLEGFSGVGHSVEDCLYKAKWGMEEHVALLKEQKLPVPKANPNPKITIQNEEQLARTA